MEEYKSKETVSKKYNTWSKGLAKKLFSGAKTTLLVLLLVSAVQAKDLFSFIETDKRLHIGASYLLTDFLHERTELTWFEVGLGIGAASVAKGIYDVATGSQMDVEDAVANYIGMGLCYLINQDALRFSDGSVLALVEVNF